MPNRNIDTDFFKDPFVRKLTPGAKLLYIFIQCECSSAGIWDMDMKIASAYLDKEVTEENFREAFLITGEAITLPGNKYFFPRFIERQYPKGLSEKNPAHKTVIADLKKHGLIDSELKLIGKKKDLDIRSNPIGILSIGEIKPEVILLPPEPKPKAEKKPIEEKQSDMQKRMEEFRQTLLPYVAEFGDDMLFAPGEFFSYWTQPNKSGTKFMREQHTTWSLPHRLATWAKKYKPKGGNKPVETETAYEKAMKA